jgi:hypothetical protein
MVSILAMCVALVVADVAGQSAASDTPSPQQEYEKALQHAHDTSAMLDAKVKHLSVIANNLTHTRDLGDSILKAADRRIPMHEDFQHARTQYDEQRLSIATLRNNAKKAARNVKHSARKVEEASKRAGGHERSIERLYDQRERESENMEIHVERSADNGERALERIYDNIERQFEVYRRRAQDEQVEQAQQKQDNQAAKGAKVAGNFKKDADKAVGEAKSLAAYAGGTDVVIGAHVSEPKVEVDALAAHGMKSPESMAILLMACVAFCTFVVPAAVSVRAYLRHPSVPGHTNAYSRAFLRCPEEGQDPRSAYLLLT